MDPIVWVHYNYQDSYEQIVENFETAFQGQVYTWDETKEMMEGRRELTEHKSEIRKLDKGTKSL